MNLVEFQIELQNEQLVLSNYRALFWPRHSILVISDIHIGKTGHFRKHGIPISSEVQEKDLERLSKLINYFKAKHLIIVGDLFHAEKNVDFESFSIWRQTHSELAISLIKGNHDKLKPSVYHNMHIEVYDSHCYIEPFNFIHDPESVQDGFGICGHIHPGYMLNVKGSPRVKLPSFQCNDDYMILPAFSLFTGLAISDHQNDYKNYAFTDSAFYEF